MKARPGTERAFYEQEALWADRPLTAREDLRLRQTVAALPEAATLADIGAGDGRLACTLEAEGRGTILALSVERSWAALSRAPGLRVVGDGLAIPLRDRAVELVTICEVLEHLPVEAFTAALAELQRVAARHIVVTVPNREDLRRAMVICPSCRCAFHRHRHLRSFDAGVLRPLFSDFEMVELAEIGPEELQMPRWIVAGARRLGMVPPGGGAPICPQCGVGKIEPGIEEAAFMVAPSTVRSSPTVARRVRRAVTRVAANERLPGPRRTPWLLASYRRRG